MTPFRLCFVDFPPSVNGVAMYDTKRARYIIGIRKGLTEDDRIRTLKHELAHIMSGHHDQLDRDLREIEDEADKRAELMTDEELSELMTYQVND